MSRQKGLRFCHEVRKILESRGEEVEGPGYSPRYVKGRMVLVHKDYFGRSDLLSWDGEQIWEHQVSTWEHKSNKVRQLQGEGYRGLLWLRHSGRRVGTR